MEPITTSSSSGDLKYWPNEGAVTRLVKQGLVFDYYEDYEYFKTTDDTMEVFNKRNRREVNWVTLLHASLLILCMFLVMVEIP